MGATPFVIPERESIELLHQETDGRFHWIVLDVTAISGRRFTNTEGCAGFYVDWEPAASR
jgi:hypothetical protein